MCPVFLPLPASPEGGAPSDKHLLLFISHCDGCQYYVGRYEGDRFTPRSHGRMTWVDNAYFAPEALVDDRGRLVMWAWLLDNPPQEVINAQGWQGVYGLPRLLWLGEDGTLRMRPVDELKSLRQQELTWENLAVPAAGEIALHDRSVGLPPGGAGSPARESGAPFTSDQFEMELTLSPAQAVACGVNVCCSHDGRERTAIYYDADEQKLKLDTTNSSLGFGRKVIEAAPFELAPHEPLHLRVFVDKSVVEVYANDRQAIARRMYPTLDSRRVALYSRGPDLTVPKLTIWELMPSNPF